LPDPHGFLAARRAAARRTLKKSCGAPERFLARGPGAVLQREMKDQASSTVTRTGKACATEGQRLPHPNCPAGQANTTAHTTPTTATGAGCPQKQLRSAPKPMRGLAWSSAVVEGINQLQRSPVPTGSRTGPTKAHGRCPHARRLRTEGMARQRPASVRLPWHRREPSTIGTSSTRQPAPPRRAPEQQHGRVPSCPKNFTDRRTKGEGYLVAGSLLCAMPGSFHEFRNLCCRPRSIRDS
jgi:hypothetical protein